MVYKGQLLMGLMRGLCGGFKRRWGWLLVGLRGQRGPRPKIVFYAMFVKGKHSYQILFTGSKYIYRILKIAKYIQLPCGRALYSRLSPPTV